MSNNLIALRINNSLHVETNSIASVDHNVGPIAVNSTSRAVQGLIGTGHKADNFFVLLACAKLIASAYILTISGQDCNQPLLLWVIMMMFYDGMIVMDRVLKYKKEHRFTMATTMNSSPSSPAQGYVLDSATIPNMTEANDEEDARLVTENSLSTREDESTAQMSMGQEMVLSFIQKYATRYYVFLFCLGNTFIFASESNCPTQAPSLNTLALIFISFQYMYICIPLLVCFIIAFVCIYAICNGLIQFYRAYRAALASQNLINDLHVKKFPTALAGDPECSICMCNYEDDNEIIELECSRMHHFHADCIKKWLGVNGICPICRTSLQDMRRRKADSHREEAESPKER